MQIRTIVGDLALTVPAGAYTACISRKAKYKTELRTDGQTDVPRTGMSCAIKSADLHLRLLGRKRTPTAPRPSRSHRQPRSFILKQIDTRERLLSIARRWIAD